jgi:hypothetical protein
MLTEYYGQRPPPVLHHYTDAAGLLGIIKGRALWATHIRFLNDAREFVHAVNLAESYVQKLKGQHNPSLLSILGTTLEGMPGNTFVISFSEDGDVLSQWRGYCRSGGYSMDFVSQKLQQFATEQRFVLVKCTYDRNEQERLIQNLILEAIREFPHYVPTEILPTVMTEEDRARFFAAKWFFPKMQRLASAMKDPSFKEEREWRLIGALFVPLPPLDLRPRGSLLIPYETFKLESSAAPTFEGVISRVLVGPNPDQDLAVFGIERMKQCGYIGWDMQIETSKIPYRVT